MTDYWTLADDAAHFLDADDHPNGHSRLQELLDPITQWSSRIGKTTRAIAAVAIFMTTILGVTAVVLAILSHNAAWPVATIAVIFATVAALAYRYQPSIVKRANQASTLPPIFSDNGLDILNPWLEGYLDGKRAIINGNGVPVQPAQIPDRLLLTLLTETERDKTIARHIAPGHPLPWKTDRPKKRRQHRAANTPSGTADTAIAKPNKLHARPLFTPWPLTVDKGIFEERAVELLGYLNFTPPKENAILSVLRYASGLKTNDKGDDITLGQLNKRVGEWAEENRLPITRDVISRILGNDKTKTYARYRRFITEEDFRRNFRRKHLPGQQELKLPS